MINARKLKPYLIKEKDKPLASLSLVYGQEILLNIEAIEILRNRAKQEEFNDIKVLEIEKPSDWQIVYQEMQPSFFSPKVFLELHLKAKSLDKNVVEFFNSFKKRTVNTGVLL